MRNVRDSAVDSLSSGTLCKIPVEAVNGVPPTIGPVPVKGALAYDVNQNNIYFADGAAWHPLGGGGSTTILADARQCTGAVLYPQGTPINFDITISQTLTASGNVSYFAGTYTVINGGNYFFSARANASTTPTIGLVKNGTSVYNFRLQTNGGGIFGGETTGIIVCSPGDTFSLQGLDAGVTMLDFKGTSFVVMKLS